LPAEIPQDDGTRSKLESSLASLVLEMCWSLWEEFSALAASLPPHSALRDRELLRWYEETHYKLSGGGKCAVCHAHVRNVVPVKAEHKDGKLVEYSSLCTRCLMAEKAVSEKVWLQIGSAQLDAASEVLSMTEGGNGTKVG
jgi:hypothetical protein